MEVVELIESLKWPVVLISIIFAFMLIFRAAISDFISRAQKLKWNNGEVITSANVPQNSSPESVAEKVTEISRAAGDSNNIILLKEGYASVLYSATERDFPDHEQRIKFLCNFAANENREKWFEVIYRAIYGSQIKLLDHLNSGATFQRKLVEEDYLSNKEKYGLENVEFQQWMTFLLNFNLITDKNANLNITQDGRDFLLYLVRNRYSQSRPL